MPEPGAEQPAAGHAEQALDQLVADRRRALAGSNGCSQSSDALAGRARTSGQARYGAGDEQQRGR